jgi:hypothetical protein
MHLFIKGYFAYTQKPELRIMITYLIEQLQLLKILLLPWMGLIQKHFFFRTTKKLQKFFTHKYERSFI